MPNWGVHATGERYLFTARSMLKTLQKHWGVYLIEAAGLATFMLSACLLTALLEHPASAVRHALPSATFRRALLGFGMGGTAMAIVYSPWGQRSGAHINPAVTLAYLRLRAIRPCDAAFYVLAQFAGGVLGVRASAALIPREIADPTVRFAVTVPGELGVGAALATELAISFVLMTVVLAMATRKKVASLAGLATGVLVALYVFFAGPVSGFGMNPARSAGSALVADTWTAWWVYLFAPPIAMLVAAEAHVRFDPKPLEVKP